jgi:hypothetical protein
MFFDDHKKHVTSIMSKRSPKGEALSQAPMKAEHVSDEAGEVDPRHLAAQDVLAAHHEKSPMKLMEALSNFIDLHDAHSEPQSE